MQALVVDDSLAMRSIMGRILRELGFEVIEAKNGQEALNHLERGAHPRVALVDWNMPVMDGVAFLRNVRGNAAWSDVPVMMVTAESESSLVLTALEAGANDYLMKPFTREALVEKLDLLGVDHG
jgi:two-component system, chemotaxis family, chemotaxis protein CheY